ncbi:hypothetical protein HDU67_002216 [Dinochytrium kinnereticum]|nr:hypothetical protein HDU67_002216 [Dinochytrium kinnereticum]
MKLKLRFKGEPKKKSKKRKAEDGEADHSSSTTELTGWDMVESIDELTGPIMLLSNTTEPPTVLTCTESDTTKVSFKEHPVSTITYQTAEPTNVNQVFQVSRLPTTSAKFSFKSAYDKYLTSDKFGIVSASTEAVGPAEEWEVIFREDGVALQSARGTYLCAEEDVARADSGSIGFREVFRIRCQAENKARVKKKKVDGGDLDAENFEAEQL